MAASEHVTEQELATAFGVTCTQGLMKPGQYFRVARELMARTPCWMLIFGAGADSRLWALLNRGGRTVVVERHERWAAMAEEAGCEVIRVNYATRLRDGWVTDPALPSGLEEDLLGEGWDVVLVDGPEGHREDDPGRQQSIRAASLAMRPGSTVFVHDYHRPMERAASARYLGTLSECLGEKPALAVVQIT